MVLVLRGGSVLGYPDNEVLLYYRKEEFDGVAFHVDYRLASEFGFPVPIYAYFYTFNRITETRKDLS
jgi:hypothetical protein